MPYSYDPIFAVDPANSANIAKNAAITIFDPADPAQSPIAITDPTGSPLPNPITVDAAGMAGAFQHPTLARVGWKGAGFTGYFTSYEGMLNETIAAKDAAQNAASEAATGAANALAVRVAAGEFKGAPGRDGVNGLNGSNVLPTQEAIQQAINLTGIRPVRAQAPATLAASPVDDGGRTACWMDATRTRIFAAYRTILRYTDDDGASWIDVPGLKITKDIIAVRDLDNGEVLVSAGGVGSQSELWVSTGFRANPQTATWRKTKTAASPGVYFSNSWSFSVHKNIVLVNEYGPKAGGNGNARYTYMSLDHGQTWKTIYDLGTATGNHLHGVCYDPYWDRIWITYGDDTSAIVYSDNLGANWSVAQSTTASQGDFQAVGILAMPSCVLFASDGQPNGVLRIPRTAGKSAGTYIPEVAYQLDNATSLTWLGHLAFRAQRAGDDAPALFPFAPELSTGKSKVLATTDGYTFNVVWEDTINTTSRGAITALGPTARGKLWIVSSDARQANYTKWVGAMPVGY